MNICKRVIYKLVTVKFRDTPLFFIYFKIILCLHLVSGVTFSSLNILHSKEIAVHNVREAM